VCLGALILVSLEQQQQCSLDEVLEAFRQAGAVLHSQPLDIQAVPQEAQQER
jgi:hypothetical protein